MGEAREVKTTFGIRNSEFGIHSILILHTFFLPPSPSPSHSPCWEDTERNRDEWKRSIKKKKMGATNSLRKCVCIRSIK